VLNLDGVPDQATSPLDKGEFVCETALQKHAYAKVSSYVGHCDQRHVLGHSLVHQVVGLDQDKEGLRRRGLDLGELAPEGRMTN
jgi:hypothetical protein